MVANVAAARLVRAVLLVACLAAPTLDAAHAGQTDRTLPVLAAGNVIPVTARTPHAGFNRLEVSVTVCEPGTTRCATIDDVMLDTGSTGLRLEASAVPAWMTLPAHLGPDGRPLAECLHFVHDDAWGPLHRVDLHLGGLMAADLPIQVIADDQRPQPAACPPSTVHPTSNGTLGLGPHLFDCPGACEQSATRPTYFVDRSGTWTPFVGRLDAAFRLPNPVARLPAHNNGVVFDLPTPPGGDAREVVGTLTFGVGSAPNNALGTTQLLRLDPRGMFPTLYRGRSYPDSFIDSGTETYILEDGDLPRCPALAWAFCATPDRWVEATMVDAAGTRLPWSLRVGDYQAILARRDGASNGMAVAADAGTRTFVWGAPFFLGKRVTIVFDGHRVPAVEGSDGPLYGIALKGTERSAP